MQESVDVIVAGAGIAGMAAADWLSQAGLSVILLEASPRLGGNARAGKGPDGSPFPAGSTVLCTYTAEQRTLLEGLGLALDDRRKILPDRVRSDDGWSPLLPRRTHHAVSSLQWQLDDFLDCCEHALAVDRGLPATFHELRRECLIWDRQTFEDAFCNAPPELTRILDAIVRSDAGHDGSQVSALAAMVDLLVCLRGEGYVLPGGNYALVESIVGRLTCPNELRGRVSIRTCTRITSVTESPTDVIVRVADTSNDNSTLVGRQLLLAMPTDAIANLKGIALEQEQRELLRSLTRRPYTIANFFLDRSPLDSNAFYVLPNGGCVTDVLQMNSPDHYPARAGDRLPSTLTAYLPGWTVGDGGEQALLEKARHDILEAFNDTHELVRALHEATGELSVFERAMGAPAPGQIAQLASIGPQLGRRVLVAHSDFAFFSAVGAVQAALNAVERIVSAIGDPTRHPPLLRRNS